jgi:hypothetical protein
LLSGWSSFPSDHACLFFALATGLCLISPVIGGLALLHASLIVSLPRIYLGLHYPTDVLAGAPARRHGDGPGMDIPIRLQSHRGTGAGMEQDEPAHLLSGFLRPHG